MFKLKLHWQILIGLVLAALIAISIRAFSEVPTATGVLGVSFYDCFDFVGKLFLRALKMLVVPLIVSSIIASVASIGKTRALGRLGAKTAGYYLTTSTFAVLIGLVVARVAMCGDCDGVPCKDQIGLGADVGDVREKVEGRTAGDVVDVFLRMVPSNVFQDAAEGQMLGLIFFSILFGIFMHSLGERYRTVLGDFWQAVNDVMLAMTAWVLKFAPVGVFGLVASTVLSAKDLGAFQALACFFVMVIVALSLHAFVVLPALLYFVGRVSPYRHFRAMAPALLMAFSSASSSATLPLTMERVEHGAGVSKRVTSFTLPLGATVNMDGTALYECGAALFIAQAYGLHLSFAQQFTVVIVALLTSIGVAGIPSASLVAITLILSTIGLPLEAVGLILAVDRVLDMCRTAVNVLSDSTAAVVVARSEGEANILLES